MRSINNLVYLTSEEYHSETHVPETFYLVKYDNLLKLYHDEKEVTNVIKCSSLPQNDEIVPETFYILKNNKIIRLYYSYSYENTKLLIPVADSSIVDITKVEDSIKIKDQTSEKVVVGLSTDNTLSPSSVNSQVLDAFGDMNLRPKWNFWE